MSTGAVAYLVLAYHKPEQLFRLLERLRRGSPRAPILLHFDAKYPLPDQSRLSALGTELVEPRIDVQWGDYSLVQAILAGLSQLLNRRSWEYVQLLSGQDYPLRPLPEIEAALLGSQIDAFIDATHQHGYHHRYLYRYWKIPKFRYAYLLPRWLHAFDAALRTKVTQSQDLVRFEWVPRGLAQRVGLKRLNHPFTPSMPCWFGSDWFTLSRRAAEYLLETLEKRRDLVQVYRTSIIPSESLFATILCNSHLQIQCRDNRRFIVWLNDAAAHPVTLTMQHFDAIIESGKDFGRKFDMDVDSRVLDALDRHIEDLSSAESKS